MKIKMRFTYYLFLGFAKLFSIIPFRLLYVFSDGLCFLFYYLIPYRKKIIYENISRSFSTMSENKKEKLVKSFYGNLCDILLEGIKGFSMSKEALIARYTFINPEVMNAYFDKGQQVISVGAHYANWEWGMIVVADQLKHKMAVFYTPLTNNYIDTYMRNSRIKFGAELIPKAEVRKAFSRKNDQPVTYFFCADQSPTSVKGAHWMNFLNQDTPCMKGHEFFARKYNLPVVYFDVQRVKRGYYSVRSIVLEEHPIDTASGEITEKYMNVLEGIIIRKPQDYLWSHRKWKHKKLEA